MPGSPDRTSFTPGRVNASPSDTQGGSRVPELGPLGSVRGALSNGRPYRDYPGAYGIPFAGVPMKWNLGVSNVSSSAFQPPMVAKKASKAARKSASFG